MLKSLLRRIAAASRILFLPGDHTPVTRKDLQRFAADWAEWEITFSEILEKLNAWYARQSKREKRYLARQMDDAAESPPGLNSATPPLTSFAAHKLRKAALRRRAVGETPHSPPPPAEDVAETVTSEREDEP